MRQSYGSSKSGDLKAALSGITNPNLLILMSNAKQFDEHVRQLEEIFPGVPSIGCIGNSYAKSVCEDGVGVTAFSGVSAAAGVLENVSVMPAKYIKRLEDDIKKVKAEQNNSVVIDLCSGNDACVMTTIDSVLGRSGIRLMGGTGDGGRVSCCGRVYEDADAYAVVKNLSGKVRVYKENMYRPLEGDYRFIASKTDRAKYYVGELNGRPAKQVYMETLGITEKEMETSTFKNPLGKMIGKDICIISLNKVEGNGIICYRQVNDSDVLTLLDRRDYREIVQETIDAIKKDFSKISGIYSVNCVFRYIVFTQDGVMDDYLSRMSNLGMHSGLIGFGEHNCSQFVNQTMTCAVFE